MNLLRNWYWSSVWQLCQTQDQGWSWVGRQGTEHCTGNLLNTKNFCTLVTMTVQMRSFPTILGLLSEICLGSIYQACVRTLSLIVLSWCIHCTQLDSPLFDIWYLNWQYKPLFASLFLICILYHFNCISNLYQLDLWSNKFNQSHFLLSTLHYMSMLPLIIIKPLVLKIIWWLNYLLTYLPLHPRLS